MYLSFVRSIIHSFIHSNLIIKYTGFDYIYTCSALVTVPVPVLALTDHLVFDNASTFFIPALRIPRCIELATDAKIHSGKDWYNQNCIACDQYGDTTTPLPIALIAARA